MGWNAEGKRGVISTKYPIERGIVVTWDDAEKLLHHMSYNELRIGPEETAFLMSSAILNPRYHREKMTQTLFETFTVPEFSLGTMIHASA